MKGPTSISGPHTLRVAWASAIAGSDATMAGTRCIAYESPQTTNLGSLAVMQAGTGAKSFPNSHSQLSPQLMRFEYALSPPGVQELPSVPAATNVRDKTAPAENTILREKTLLRRRGTSTKRQVRNANGNDSTASIAMTCFSTWLRVRIRAKAKRG